MHLNFRKTSSRDTSMHPAYFSVQFRSGSGRMLRVCSLEETSDRTFPGASLTASAMCIFATVHAETRREPERQDAHVRADTRVFPAAALFGKRPAKRTRREESDYGYFSWENTRPFLPPSLPPALPPSGWLTGWLPLLLMDHISEFP